MTANGHAEPEADPGAAFLTCGVCNGLFRPENGSATICSDCRQRRPETAAEEGDPPIRGADGRPAGELWP
jgi:hypothetical protein